MAYATYGGAFIFGNCVAMQTSRNPPCWQDESVFGEPGHRLVYGGSRGATTRATGVIGGFGLIFVEAQAAAWGPDGLGDGKPRRLTDTFGIPWDGVRIDSFEWVGRPLWAPGYICWRRYKAELSHDRAENAL